MMFPIDSTIMWCERKWKVGAVMWLGERYYALVRPGAKVDTVSLIPEVCLERSGAKLYVPPRASRRLRAVPSPSSGAGE